MKTQELFQLLKSQQEKLLLFEYKTNEFVRANYHITEVKHTKIDSVDCGAKTDAWNETIIQLWESPTEIGKRDYMTVGKALSILDRVAEMRPFDLLSEVKFEYSNNTFHTAQLFVNDFEIRDNNLIIKLAIKKTDCKAKSVCGVPEKVINVVEKVAEKVEYCCEPNSKCC